MKQQKNTNNLKIYTFFSLPDMQLLYLDSKIFANTLFGNTTMKLNQERRKSTILGVKVMFNKYKQQKWESIQKLSSHLLQTLQPDGDHQTEPWQTTSTQENDNMVVIATDMFYSQYRSK